MGKLLIVIALGAGAYYAYNHFRNPANIKDPVYVEIHMDIPAGSRKITMALFGKGADEQDCRERSERVWKKIIDGCPDCQFQVLDCKRELDPRYARMFDDEIGHVTYLSLTRGSRYERDGRMIFWGLTPEEGNSVCDEARAEFKKRYAGDIRCVRAASR